MSKAKNSTPKNAEHAPGRGTRETIESIVIAIILAFLFRAFEAEAFVIPTGSMAPTLQGQHIELECPKCHYWYRTGASAGNAVYETTCPICRFAKVLQIERDAVGKVIRDEAEEKTYSGDRILVSKFAYDLPGAEPQRWDVIVFKFPGNGKINYIKRLIGLPGEKVLIRQGNIYVKRREDAGYRIARKTEHSPAKLKAMLQLVDDTDFIPSELIGAGWPMRWQDWSNASEGAWTSNESGNVFQTDGSHGETLLRYRHLIAEERVWSDLAAWNAIGEIEKIDELQAPVVRRMLNLGDAHTAAQIAAAVAQFDANGNGIFDPGEKQAALRQLAQPSLIHDFYAYNAGTGSQTGNNWVGDLAVECELEVKSDKGYVLLNLVRGGVNYDCRIDVASGKATLSIDGEMKEFLDGDGAAAARAVTEISGLKGPGRYQLRFANVDNELVLWVNDQPVTFDVPTTYQDEGDVNPQTGSGASDLTPIGIGSDGAALEITRLKVLRDVYYVADAAFYPADPRSGLDSADGIELPFDDPLVEGDDDPNDEGYLGDDQYLPLGDNSPQSMDSRLWRVDRSRDWPIPTSVSRRMLLGKALFIYWPHPWHGFVPNFARMGFIR